MHRTDKYSQHSSIIWPVWLNGWVLVYELNGCGFETRCSHLNFRFRACFEQGVPWIQATIECGFTLKRVRDMIRTYSQMHRTEKYSQHSSIIWPVWLNGWVFVYELNGCGFESRCSNLNFRFRACFEKGVPWHSGNYRLWIDSETRRDMIRTYSEMHRTYKYSPHSSIIWPVWLNGWVFAYELNGCGVESRCSHLNFRFRACFEQGVPWHSGNYRVLIHCETRTWRNKNIQSNAPYR